MISEMFSRYVCCSVLQCVVVCCSVLQCVAHVDTLIKVDKVNDFRNVLEICVFQCVAVCCSVLQCVAVCCAR